MRSHFTLAGVNQGAYEAIRERGCPGWRTPNGDSIFELAPH